ncbi:MAG: hypothetical protein ACKESB_01535 [Candidatus Hodgkinia cicadicola]
MKVSVAHTWFYELMLSGFSAADGIVWFKSSKLRIVWKVTMRFLDKVLSGVDISVNPYKGYCGDSALFDIAFLKDLIWRSKVKAKAKSLVF